MKINEMTKLNQEENQMTYDEEVLVNCDNLVKLYKTEEVEVLALQGLELQIKRGEMIAIIGKSGSGKSTLLNMLGGLEQPSAGRLYVDGKDLFALNEKNMVKYRRKTVGFVWQNSARNLFPYMTVLENITCVMEAKRKNEKKEYAKFLLEKVGLLEKAESFPIQLSGGEQQRVAIAVALANKPILLLADEPTGAVDEKTSRQIQNLFNQLNKELGLTIVIVTHDVKLADRVKRVVMISDGKIGTEKIMRREYEKKLREMHSFEAQSEENLTHDEYVVLDRSKRLQLSDEICEAAGIYSKKVKIRVENQQVIITSADDSKI